MAGTSRSLPAVNWGLVRLLDHAAAVCLLLSESVKVKSGLFTWRFGAQNTLCAKELFIQEVLQDRPKEILEHQHTVTEIRSVYQVQQHMDLNHWEGNRFTVINTDDLESSWLMQNAQFLGPTSGLWI